MTTDAVTALLTTYLFADLTPAEIAPLARTVTHASFRAGEAVYQPGDAADAIYVVLAGHLKETIANADGDELTTELLAAGDVFGEVGIFSPERDRITSIVAVDDSRVLVLSRRTLLPYLLDHPLPMMRLLEALVAMIRETFELAVTTAFANIEDRVALKLAELADLHGTEHPAGVLIDMHVPQSLMASLVGASRTNVNRALAKLTGEGAVQRLGRDLVVTDPAALRASVAASERLLHRRNRRST
jgi:CRP/FNR family transcriptional regulator